MRKEINIIKKPNSAQCLKTSVQQECKDGSTLGTHRRGWLAVHTAHSPLPGHLPHFSFVLSQCGMRRGHKKGSIAKLIYVNQRHIHAKHRLPRQADWPAQGRLCRRRGRGLRTQSTHKGLLGTDGGPRLKSKVNSILCQLRFLKNPLTI